MKLFIIKYKNTDNFLFTYFLTFLKIDRSKNRYISYVQKFCKTEIE